MVRDGNGHGCGHTLLGVGALMGAVGFIHYTTIKKRKLELKKTVDLIEEIIKDGAISDANFRLMVMKSRFMRAIKS